jgi:hypothetical protein
VDFEELHRYDSLSRSLDELATRTYNKMNSGAPSVQGSTKRDDEIQNARPSRRSTVARVVTTQIQAGNLVYYKVPKIRKNVEWHEEAEHEHDVDWADLFFDLTYVEPNVMLSEYHQRDVIDPIACFLRWQLRCGSLPARWKSEVRCFTSWFLLLLNACGGHD